jgi:hypothetical protein
MLDTAMGVLLLVGDVDFMAPRNCGDDIGKSFGYIYRTKG